MTSDDMMKSEEIDRLRALCEATTPGPWTSEPLDESIGTVESLNGEPIAQAHQIVGDRVHSQRKRNAAFIAAAREAVPALLDEVERLRPVADMLAGGPAGTIVSLLEQAQRERDEARRVAVALWRGIQGRPTQASLGVLRQHYREQVDKWRKG